MKQILLLLSLVLFQTALSAQVKTAGVNYSVGAPAWTPSVNTGSELAIDTVSKRIYLWNRNTGAWDIQGRGVDQTSGSTPPAYTPNQTDSYLALNNANPPELYAWTGSAWAKVGGTVQTIDTFSVSGSIVSLSLSGDAQPAKTITLPASGITALTGDVTATGPGSVAATIANGAVTGAKINQMSAAPGQVLTWDGSAWNPATPSGGGWGLTGNAVTAGSNFLGSTNNRSLRFRTNNLQRMILDSLGNAGIGTNAPQAMLDVNGQVKYNVGTWSRETRQFFPAGSAPTYILLCPAPVGVTGNQRFCIMGTIRAVRGTSSIALRTHTATFSFTSAQNTSFTHTIKNEGLFLTSDAMVLKQITYAGANYIAIKLNTSIVSGFTTAWLEVIYNFETLPANFLAVTSSGVSKESHIPESRSYSTLNTANGNLGLGSLQPASKLTFNSADVATIGVDRRIGASTAGQSMSITAGGAQTGRISTFAPLLAGTGYVVGDTISATKTFGTPAIFTVSTVDGGGGITGLTLVSTGDSYSTGGSNTSTLSGTGSGATVNVLTTVSATNSGGGTLTLSSGTSTGTQGSIMDFLTAGVSVSGATENAPALRMRITNTGDVGIGTTSPVARLHNVSTGATSSTNNFLFANSTPATILAGLDNGFIRVGNTGTFAPRFYSGSDATGGDVDLAGRNLVFNSRVTNDLSATGNFLFTGTSLTHTTGTNICFRANRTFAMPAGNATQIFNALDYTINNTGAQTGSLTGLAIRAMETALQGVAHNLMDIQVNAASVLTLTNAGRLGLSTTAPTDLLDINGANGYSQVRLRTAYTPTGTSDTNGNTGDISWDENYWYVKTAAGWKRTALTTW